MSSPVVLIPSDVRQVGINPFHCIGEKYINAIVHGTGAIPFMLPAWGEGQDLAAISDSLCLDEVLDKVDGVFLPGSPSNVHPSRYGGEFREMMLDEQRDELTFPLIKRSLAREIPIFAVCRGFQELNVALGGTLYSAVHEIEGYLDHREDTSLPRDEQYAPAHGVDIQADGVLEQLIGEPAIRVNSLHAQGVRELAPPLQVEAIAEDGLIEAFSLPNKPVLGVQWHPEWHYSQTQHYKALFDWFGEQVRASTKTGVG